MVVLIATILEEGLDKLANVERLILQPNNREDELRSWLQEHGFQIVAESILEEAGKFLRDSSSGSWGK